MKSPAPLATAFFAAALFIPACGKSQDIRRYKIQSAIVSFTLSGTQSGTETLWFDRYGNREAKLTQSSMTVVGQTIKTNKLVITDLESIITVDLDNKTATKMPLPKMTANLIESVKKKGGDMTDLGTEMIRQMGAVKTGTETVAGKPCDVWEIKNLGSKSWVWNGVTLKNETRFGGQSMKQEAASVQENATVPDDKFAVPAGISITEAADPLEALRKARAKANR